MVRSARKRSKYAFATAVSTSRTFASDVARAMAASPRATSRRAARFPPSGSGCVICTIRGTVERSMGAFQSWTMSIGSSRAPAGETAASAARARPAAARNSGLLRRASARRSERWTGVAAATRARMSDSMRESFDVTRCATAVPRARESGSALRERRQGAQRRPGRDDTSAEGLHAQRSGWAGRALPGRLAESEVDARALSQRDRGRRRCRFDGRRRDGELARRDRLRALELTDQPAAVRADRVLSRALTGLAAGRSPSARVRWPARPEAERQRQRGG